MPNKFTELGTISKKDIKTNNKRKLSKKSYVKLKNIGKDCDSSASVSYGKPDENDEWDNIKSSVEFDFDSLGRKLEVESDNDSIVSDENGIGQFTTEEKINGDLNDVDGEGSDDFADPEEYKNVPGSSSKLDFVSSNTPVSMDPVQFDEYGDDSSDEEDRRNTIGNVPLEWYKEHKHIGYTTAGKKIIKPTVGDHLDNFVSRMEDPNFWKTVLDKQTGQNVVLSEEDVAMIKQIQSGQYGGTRIDPYESMTPYFSQQEMIHPISNQPDHKRSFLPSRWEKQTVGKFVHSMKMGWMKPSWTLKKKKSKQNENKFYDIWEEENVSKGIVHHIPAPRAPLPTHYESYNPPPEYILSAEEIAKWRKTEPYKRRVPVIPRPFSCMRKVPGYGDFMKERFDRCLDLYLCPRKRKVKLNIDPDDLLPKLPRPRDLQPFPSIESLRYLGHTKLVRSISVDLSGQWLVSGSDDCSIKIWEVSTARCLKTVKFESAVYSVKWCPSKKISLIAVASGPKIVLMNSNLGCQDIVDLTDNLLASTDIVEREEAPAKWKKLTMKNMSGRAVEITVDRKVKQLSWHSQGDYLISVLEDGDKPAILIHQFTKFRSQSPFKKMKGFITNVQFHPHKPLIFIALQRTIRVYDLVKQELFKKLHANARFLSSMAIHPAGDNLIVGSYDCRLSWFDLDLSTKPYKTLRHQKKAIRQVAYHSRYPLFASAADDGSVIICHGRVYNDLLQNALIVPVKVLRGHSTVEFLSVLDIEFHPLQPWIFSSGADCTIRLYS